TYAFIQVCDGTCQIALRPGRTSQAPQQASPDLKRRRIIRMFHEANRPLRAFTDRHAGLPEPCQGDGQPLTNLNTFAGGAVPVENGANVPELLPHLAGIFDSFARPHQWFDLPRKFQEIQSVLVTDPIDL